LEQAVDSLLRQNMDYDQLNPSYDTLSRLSTYLRTPAQGATKSAQAGADNGRSY
jgi:hypothetical protein